MHEEEMIYDLMRERDKFQAEVERLRAEVQRLDIAGTHSCHDDCPKLPCVQRREIERLRAELAAAKAASVVPVQVFDCFADIDRTAVVILWSNADAKRFADWLRDRIGKRGEEELSRIT